MLQLKRAYEDHATGDGCRILVERLWPRGLSKEKAKVDLWLKEIAPSTELRKWYGHRPERWPEFKRRYFEELEQRPEAAAELKRLVKSGPVTLIYGARGEERNSAVVLQEWLHQKKR